MSTQFYAYVHARPNSVSSEGIFYVGKGQGKRAKDFSRRNFHHTNTVNKYGVENILVGKIECSSEEIAFDLEKGLIKCLRRNGVKLVNMSDGGEGSSGYVPTEQARHHHSICMRGRKHKKETLEKMSLSRTGEKNAFYGKKHSAETRIKISKNRAGLPAHNKGISPSLETRVKISNSLTGRKGHPTSEETRKKISSILKGRKGKPVSAETRKKLSEAVTRSWIARRKNKTNKGEV